MSGAFYDFDYYELIQLHPNKWELPCLILARHKLAYLVRGLRPDYGGQTVQECEFNTWVKVIGEKSS